MAAAPMTVERYRHIALAALIALGAIVLTGAAVRLTGSGLGCSDWPTCEEGTLVPDRGGVHSAIEFGNRVFSIVPAVAVGLAALGARRRVPYRSDLVWWAWGLVAGVVVQIIVGAIVVRTDLLPSAVIVHFLLSMVLLWNALVLYHRAATPYPSRAVPRAPSAIVNMGRAMVAIAAYVLVSGTLVTGAGPHSGDATDPERLPYFLPDVVRLHSAGVVVLCALTAAIVAWTWPRPGADPVRRGALVLLGAIVAQASVGYIQYFNGVPALLVGFHILGAMLVWIAVLQFHMSLFARVETPVTREPEAALAR